MEFIQKYNELVKLTHENMRKEGFEEDELMFNLIIFNNNLSTKIEDLIALFRDEEELALTYFSFLKEIEVKGKYKFFGFNPCHNFYYVIDEDSNEILEIDIDKETIVFHCGKNIDSFFDSWCKIIDFDAFFYLNKAKYEDEKVRLQYKNDCIRLAGREKYSKFYESIF